jgi:uncharacterized protein YndB with AHSA1/START domain
MFKYVCPSELMMSIKDQEEPQTEVRKSIVIESTPEVIFKAITNQRELTNWLPDLSIPEPRIGGKISIVCRKGTRWQVNNETKVLDKDYFFEGIIQELIPNKTISFTIQNVTLLPEDPETNPEYTETWNIEEIDHHKTKVELIQSGFTGKEKGMIRFEDAEMGLPILLDQLAKYCKGRG